MDKKVSIWNKKRNKDCRENIYDGNKDEHFLKLNVIGCWSTGLGGSKAKQTIANGVSCANNMKTTGESWRERWADVHGGNDDNMRQI